MVVRAGNGRHMAAQGGVGHVVQGCRLPQRAPLPGGLRQQP